MADLLLVTAKVDRSDLEERVYSELRARILARDIPPGTVLTLRQVAEALDVSATPVRDAPRRLKSEGLVKKEGKLGHSVAGLSARDVEDLFGARLAIEGYAARLAVEQPDRHLTLARPRQVATEFPATFSGDRYLDFERFRALDAEFHLAIVAAPKNAFLVTMYQSLNVHRYLIAMHYHELERRTQATHGDREAAHRLLGKEQRAVANHHEHLAIVEGFASGQADEMVRAVETHIVNVRDHLLRMHEPGRLI